MNADELARRAAEAIYLDSMIVEGSHDPQEARVAESDRWTAAILREIPLAELLAVADSIRSLGGMLEFRDDENGPGEWHCDLCCARMPAKWSLGRANAPIGFKHADDCAVMLVAALDAALAKEER